MSTEKTRNFPKMYVIMQQGEQAQGQRERLLQIEAKCNFAQISAFWIRKKKDLKNM
jgi:hypothetical protein